MLGIRRIYAPFSFFVCVCVCMCMACLSWRATAARCGCRLPGGGGFAVWGKEEEKTRTNRDEAITNRAWQSRSAHLLLPTFHTWRAQGLLAGFLYLYKSSLGYRGLFVAAGAGRREGQLDSRCTSCARTYVHRPTYQPTYRPSYRPSHPPNPPLHQPNQRHPPTLVDRGGAQQVALV